MDDKNRNKAQGLQIENCSKVLIDTNSNILIITLKVNSQINQIKDRHHSMDQKTRLKYGLCTESTLK